MQTSTSLRVPVELIPLVEEWGKMTAEVFGRLRNSAGLKPLNVPKSQEWFWSEEWQAGEKKIDDELAKGEYASFNSMDDLIKDLHSHV